LKDAKLKDGDYILWDYKQPEKKSKIPVINLLIKYLNLFELLNMIY
jgi:hypothetical protein